MRLIWIAGAILLSSNSWADSQLIPPVSLETETADINNQSSESDQQKTKKSPVVVDLKITSQGDKAANNQQQHADAESDKWTDPITIFTGALVLIGFLQFFVYWKQKGVMENALKATNRQIDLARTEFVASHRPKIIIRRVSLDEGTPPNAPIGRETKIQFVVANVGESAGTIVEGSVSYELTNRLPAIPFFQEESELPRVRIGRGQHFAHAYYPPVDFVAVKWMDQKRRENNLDDAGINLWFYGYVCYVDDIPDENLRGLRRTGFCFVYNPKTDRFDKVNDPNYSYED